MNESTNVQDFKELFRPPEAPARNADSHKDVDHHLDEEDEEERKEVEGTVTPVETHRDPDVILNTFRQIHRNILKLSSCMLLINQISLQWHTYVNTHTPL